MQLVSVLQFFWAIWKSRHQHRHWSRHWHCKKLILPFEVLIFAFRSFPRSKTSLWKSFSSTLAGLPGYFSCCYLVDKPLRPASQERHLTLDIISGVLKTRKAESCSLQVCKFLIRHAIRDHLLKIFFKFQSSFKKFG